MKPTRQLARLTALVLLLTGTAAAPASAQSALPPPTAQQTVSVAQGQVAGSVLPSGVSAYLGIPFAAPPLGQLRWREPQAPAPWTGVRQAVAYPPMCVQGMRGTGQNHYFGAEPTSEDCLYLNVWTPPGAKAGAKLPVVVWIYGGGFTGGSSSMMWARGEPLARKGVVYVSVNYRVGSLGFMAHPELTAEAGGHSGDYGFLDQVAGLRWVHDNIAAFGGDPAQVTLLGQSAGSMSLSALHASPMTKGLFQRAIGLSGSVLTTGAGSLRTLADAEKSGLALQKALGVASLDDLRRLPADKVVGAPGVRFEPTVDGYFLPKPPSEIFAAHQQNDVGLLVGFTRDEGFNPLGSAKSADDYQAMARRLYGAQADELLRRYPANQNWQRNAKDAARDASLGVSMWNWAAGQTARKGRPAYAYMFSRVHPYKPGVKFIDHDPTAVGAYHAGDIVYWTGNLDAFNAFRTTRDWTAQDRALSEAMSDMVVAFARTGNPATSAAPAVRFDPARPRLIELGDQIRVLDWPHATDLDFLNALPPPAGPAPGPASAARGGPQF